MRRTPIGMLASGGGRTVENMAAACREGRVPAEVVGVVSSSPRAGVLERARRLGLPAAVVPPREHAGPAELGEACCAFLRELGAEWILFGGWLAHLLPPPDYAERTLNIHPALIPAFCGKGMYGRHVHEAVLAAGVEITGCTVHFVDELYDHGPIVHQVAVRVEPGDDADRLTDRVFAAEKEAYHRALAMLLTGRARLAGKRVVRSP